MYSTLFFLTRLIRPLVSRSTTGLPARGDWRVVDGRRALELDAELLRARHALVELGRLEHRLGRDAADGGTCRRALAVVDERDLEAQLAGAECGASSRRCRRRGRSGRSCWRSRLPSRQAYQRGVGAVYAHRPRQRAVDSASTTGGRRSARAVPTVRDGAANGLIQWGREGEACPGESVLGGRALNRHRRGAGECVDDGCSGICGASPPGSSPSTSTDLPDRIASANPIDGCMLIGAYDDGPADSPSPSAAIGLLCGSTLTTLEPISADLPFGAQWSPDHSRIAYMRRERRRTPARAYTIAVPTARTSRPMPAPAPERLVQLDCRWRVDRRGCSRPMARTAACVRRTWPPARWLALVAGPTDGRFSSGRTSRPPAIGSCSTAGTRRFMRATWTCWIANADGSDAKLLIGSATSRSTSPAFGPDGSSIVYDLSDIPGPGDLHVRDLATGTDVTLMTTPVVDDCPIWSSDGADGRLLAGRTRTGSATTSRDSSRRRPADAHRELRLARAHGNRLDHDVACEPIT